MFASLCQAEGLVLNWPSCTVTETPETSCSDTIDNDCDGDIDGADSDCAAGNSDTFTGANDTLLATHDANWVSGGGSSKNVAKCEIISNQLQPVGTYDECGAMYNTSSSDISQAIFKGGATSSYSELRDLCVRMGTTTAGYCAFFQAPSGGNWTSIHITKNGSDVESTSGETFATASDHTVKITASGTGPVTITVFIDGTEEASFVDSTSPITTGKPGLRMYPDGNLANSRIDDWQDY